MNPSNFLKKVAIIQIKFPQKEFLLCMQVEIVIYETGLTLSPWPTKKEIFQVNHLTYCD